jgi:hypothetical protein
MQFGFSMKLTHLSCPVLYWFISFRCKVFIYTQSYASKLYWLEWIIIQRVKLKRVSYRLNQGFLIKGEKQKVVSFNLRNMNYKLCEGKTTYTFSVSVNAFSVEFPLACYQQAGRVWYISGALGRTYTLFYPAPYKFWD